MRRRTRARPVSTGSTTCPRFPAAATSAARCRGSNIISARAVTGARTSATSNLGARSAEFRADGIEGVDGSRFTWLDFFRQHGNYLKPSSFSTMSLIGVALRGMLITLSVYTAILALMFWAMQVGGVLPPAGTLRSVGRPSATHRVLAAVHRADRRWRLPAVRHRELARQHSHQGHDVHRLGAATAVRDRGVSGCCSAIPMAASRSTRDESALALARGAPDSWSPPARASSSCGGPRTTTTRRAAARTWSTNGSIACASSTSRCSDLCSPASRCWWPSGAFRTSINSSSRRSAERCQAGLSSSLLGVIGAVYQFIAGRDKKSTSSAFSTLRILLTSVLLVYGILLVAYSIVQAGEQHPVPCLRHRRAADGLHRLRRRVRRLHRERQLHRHRPHVSRPAHGTVHARQGSHPRQPVATRRQRRSVRHRQALRRRRHARSDRCTSSIATWSWWARARTGSAAAAATASC